MIRRYSFLLVCITLFLLSAWCLQAQTREAEVYVDEVYNYAWRIPVAGDKTSSPPQEPMRYYFLPDGEFVGTDQGILTPQRQTFGYGYRPELKKDDFFYGSIVRNDLQGRYTYLLPQTTLSEAQIAASLFFELGAPQVIKLPSATFFIPTGQAEQVKNWSERDHPFSNFFLGMLADGHYFTISVNHLSQTGLVERLESNQQFGQDTDVLERIITEYQSQTLTETLLDFEYNGHRYDFQFNENGELQNIEELPGKWTTEKTKKELAAAFVAARPDDFMHLPNIILSNEVSSLEEPLYNYDVLDHGLQIGLPVHPKDLRFGPWSPMDQHLYFDPETDAYLGMSQQGWSTMSAEAEQKQKIEGKFRRIVHTTAQMSDQPSTAVMARVAHFQSANWSVARIDSLLQKMSLPRGLSVDAQLPNIVAADLGGFQVYAQDRLGISIRETSFYPCAHSLAIRQGDWLHLLTFARPYRDELLSVLNTIIFQGQQLTFSIDERFHIQNITAEKVTEYTPLDDEALELLRSFRQDPQQEISSAEANPWAFQQLQEEWYRSEADDMIRLPQLARIKASRTTNGLDEHERGITLGFVFTEPSPKLFKVALDESVCTLADDQGNDLLHEHYTFLQEYRRLNPEILSTIFGKKPGWMPMSRGGKWDFEQYIEFHTLGMPAAGSKSVQLDCELLYQFRSDEEDTAVFHNYSIPDGQVPTLSDFSKLTLEMERAGSGATGTSAYLMYRCKTDQPILSAQFFDAAGELLAEMDADRGIKLTLDEQQQLPRNMRVEIRFAKAREVKVPFQQEVQFFIPQKQND